MIKLFFIALVTQAATVNPFDYYGLTPGTEGLPTYEQSIERSLELAEELDIVKRELEELKSKCRLVSELKK